jgi:hypothetical protein
VLYNWLAFSLTTAPTLYAKYKRITRLSSGREAHSQWTQHALDFHSQWMIYWMQNALCYWSLNIQVAQCISLLCLNMQRALQCSKLQSTTNALISHSWSDIFYKFVKQKWESHTSCFTGNAWNHRLKPEINNEFKILQLSLPVMRN